ncbi:MAG: hypothetical protein ACOCP3_02525 [Halodesulfurarchaeum sp.]
MPDRAGSCARITASGLFVLLPGVGAALFVGTAPISALITPGQAVIDTSAEFMRWVGPTPGFIGPRRAYSGSERRAGKTLRVAAIAVLIMRVTRFFPAWIAASVMGERSIWLAFGASNVVGGLIAYLCYQQRTWRDAGLTEGGPDLSSEEMPE